MGFFTTSFLIMQNLIRAGVEIIKLLPQEIRQGICLCVQQSTKNSAGALDKFNFVLLLSVLKPLSTFNFRKLPCDDIKNRYQLDEYRKASCVLE